LTSIYYIMFNPRDLSQSNPLFPQSQNNHQKKIIGNPFLTNNSIGPKKVRDDNLGLNNSVFNNTYINDIFKVIVDSRNRNTTLYPIPNNYYIELGSKFTNIKRIRLIDINMSNSIPPVNLLNNSIIWEYPTISEATNISNILLPTPNLTNNKTILGTNIQEGFYTTSSLKSILEITTSKILHENEFIDVPIGSSNRFTFSIDPQTNLVKAVNRIETLSLYSLQTFLTPSEDIFASFRTGPIPLEQSFTDSIVIMIKKEITNDYFPLVITGAPSVGDVSEALFNWETFFENSLGTPLKYEFFDKLSISGVIYYRYRLIINITLQDSQNIIFKNSGGNLEMTLINANILNFITDLLNIPLVGRALPFRFIYQRSQIGEDGNLICRYKPLNEDGTIRTILDILGWNVKNDDICGVTTALYGYIQTNKNSFLLPEISFNSTIVGLESSFTQRLLRLELRDGNYYFRSDDYIFLRLKINDDQPFIGTQLLIANKIEKNDSAELDKTNVFYNVNINKMVTSSMRLQKKDLGFLFAKIDLANIPGNMSDSVVDFTAFDIDFKNEQLDELTEIQVEFVDREGRLLNLRGDHHFVLEIMTKRNVLENILFNSKNG
jgi:hypothetical protein